MTKVDILYKCKLCGGVFVYAVYDVALGKEEIKEIIQDGLDNRYLKLENYKIYLIMVHECDGENLGVAHFAGVRVNTRTN
jgi:hypothetical protein